MNGRIPAPPLPVDAAATATRRLRGALAASFAFHAFVVFMPYLGERGETAAPVAAAPPAPFAASFVVPAGSAATASVAAAPEPVRRTPPAPAAPPPAAVEAGAGLGVLPTPAPTYYPTDQLTKRPQPLVLEELDTPETRVVVASGKLVLTLWIDEQGRVAAAEAERNELPEVFARAAIAAFKNSRFQPGERNGLRVGTVMRIEVSYDDGRTAAPR